MILHTASYMYKDECNEITVHMALATRLIIIMIRGEHERAPHHCVVQLHHKLFSAITTIFSKLLSAFVDSGIIKTIIVKPGILKLFQTPLASKNYTGTGSKLSAITLTAWRTTAPL